MTLKLVQQGWYPSMKPQYDFCEVFSNGAKMAAIQNAQKRKWSEFARIAADLWKLVYPSRGLWKPHIIIFIVIWLKMAQQRPLENFKRVAPPLCLTHSYEIERVNGDQKD